MPNAREERRGKSCFEGNKARKLILIIGEIKPKLKDLSVKSAVRMLACIKPMLIFNKLVESCWGMHLRQVDGMDHEQLCHLFCQTLRTVPDRSIFLKVMIKLI